MGRGAAFSRWAAWAARMAWRLAMRAWAMACFQGVSADASAQVSNDIRN